MAALFSIVPSAGARQMHRQFPLPRLIYPRVRGETSGQCLLKFLVAACTAANEPATEAALAACTAANKDTDDSDGAHIGNICSGL
jgi:hypothetical protein